MAADFFDGIITLTVRLLILLQIGVFAQVQPRSKFKKVASCNGTDLCAVDRPSAVSTFLSDQPIVDNICVPAVVLCARSCTLRCGCVGYNYRTDSRRCEMYDDVPTDTVTQLGCSYFAVSRGQHCASQEFT